MSFDESKISRDAHGQFASEGSEGATKNIGPAKGLKAFANRHAEGDPTKPMAMLYDATSTRSWTSTLPKGMQPETWMGNYDKHPGEGGKASAARVAAVHDPIMHDALDKVEPVPAGEQKVAIMTMGAPASGKSSMLRGIDQSKFVKVNPDAIKDGIPEYAKAIADPNNTFRGAAPMAHEESSHIAKQIMAKAIEQGKHIIVDGTGMDADKFNAKIDAFHAAGYHVHVSMPHLEHEEGARRMVERANALGPNGGRYVPDAIVKHAYDTIPHNFFKIAAKADSATLFNSKPSRAEGGARKVWDKRADGSEVHHDKAFVNAFRAKYDKK